MGKNTRAFFKEYYTLMKDISKDHTQYTLQTKMFAKKLKDYMKSGKWVRKPIEQKIFNMYNSYEDSVLAYELGITLSNYRVILNRLTARLNSQILFGDTIPQVVNQDDKLVDILENINELLIVIDTDKEFDIKRDRATVRIVPQDNTELLSVLMLIALQSKDIKKHIEQLGYKSEEQWLLDNFIEVGASQSYNVVKQKLMGTTNITGLLTSISSLLQDEECYSYIKEIKTDDETTQSYDD